MKKIKTLLLLFIALSFSVAMSACTFSDSTFSITYVLNGGNNSINNYSLYSEGDAFTFDEATKRGYSFEGWFLDADFETQCSGITAADSGDKTFYAKFDIIGYSLTYNLNGGTLDEANPLTYNVETDTFTLNQPTRAGYTFLGWSGTGLSLRTKSVRIPKGSSGNRNYIANWAETTYQISYNLDGGTATNKTSYTLSAQTFTLNNPARTGYSFTGWTGTGLTTPSTSVTIISGSTGVRSYEANWSLNTYNLSYELNGGAISGTNPATFTVESNSFTLINPTQTGYTFTGWTTTGMSTPNKNVTISKGSIGNRTYTANWSLNTYSISYNLNDGSVSGTNPTLYSEIQDGFTLINPTKTGHTFDGWTGTGLTEATKIVTIPSGSTGARSYTANWTINKYNFSYATNESSMGSITCSIASGTMVDYGTSISISAQANAGYTFLNWSKPGDTVSLNSTYTFTMPQTAVSLTANFEALASDGIAYDKNSNTDFVYTSTVATATSIANVYGAGVNIHSDNIGQNASVSGKQITITKEHLQSLPIGSYDIMLSTTDASDNVVNEVIQIDITNSNPKPYNIRFNYDSLATSFVLLEFNCDCGHNNYSYSWNGGSYTTAGAENILPYYNKFASNTVTIKCNTCDTTETYTKAAAPAAANSYLGATFSLLGKTYDKYIESFEEYKAFLQYLVYSNSETATTESSITGKCYLADDFYSTFDTSMNNETLFAALGEFNMSNFCKTYWYSDDIVSRVYSITFTFKQDSTDSDKISSNYTTTSQETRELQFGDRPVLFNNFPINSWDTSMQINTLYELDELPYGVKPTFTEGSYAKRIYNQALNICRTYISDSMTDRQKVTVFYDWLAKNVCYDMAAYKLATLTRDVYLAADVAAATQHIDAYLEDYPSMTTLLTPIKTLSTPNDTYLALMDIEVRMAAYTMDGAFIYGTAVCDGYASALKLLCLIEGINCVEAFGLASGGGHAWNKVYIDNEWYCADVTWAVQNYGTFHYYLFMSDDELNQQNHEETNPGLDYTYSDILATGETNYFYGYIIDEVNNYDLVADSRAELEAIINYYIDTLNYSRFEFIINYSLGTYINNVVGDILEDKYNKLYIQVDGGTFAGMGNYCYVYFDPADIA